MATCAQLQVWLADAEEKYHTLQVGGQEVLVQSGPKQVRFSAGNVGDLVRYIAALRSQIAACTGVPDASARRTIHIQPEDSGSRFRRLG